MYRRSPGASSSRSGLPEASAWNGGAADGWYAAASTTTPDRDDCSGQPGCGWVRGDAEDVDLAGNVFDNEERVEPYHGDGVDVERVAGEDRVCLDSRGTQSKSAPPVVVTGPRRR
jgi:hypothetical protein